MSRDAKIAIQEQAAEHINAGEVDAGVDLLFAEDAIDHDPAPGQGPGREGFRHFFHTLVTAFPDANIELATLVADDDHVCIAYTLKGTHRGDFQGIAPTGARVEVRGMQIKT